MELISYESVLARLYTQATFRKSFFSDRIAVLNSLKCDEAVANHLQLLNEDEVNFFSRGLQNKRLGVVKAILPNTNNLLGENFRKYFYLYSENRPVKGMHQKHYNDAIEFVDFLSENKIAFQLNLLELELMQYDQMKAKANDVSVKLLFKFFRYPVKNINYNTIPGNVYKKIPSIIIMIRLTTKMKLKVFLI